VTFKFDPYFNVIPSAERRRIYKEAELEADLDVLLSQCARFGSRVDKQRTLAVIVNAAAACLRAKGEIDWSAVALSVVVAPQDVDVTRKAIEIMAHELAAPGVAAERGSEQWPAPKQ